MLVVLPLAAPGDLAPEPIAPPRATVAPAGFSSDAIGGEWRPADASPSRLPLPVFDAAATVADGRLAVLGGADASLRATAAIQIHDPRHGWLPIGSQLATPRAEASLLPLACGRVLVLGGWQGRLGGTGGETPRHLEDGEILDPLVAGSSFAIPPFGGSLEGHSATPDGDGGVIVVAGGLARRLDLPSGRWSEPLHIDPPRRHHAAIARRDGGVLLLGGDAGGEDSNSPPPTRIDRLEWDADLGRLRIAPTGLSLPEPLAHAAAIAASTSSPVLLVGGVDPLTGRTRGRSWWLDDAGGSIRPGPPLPDPRGAARFAAVPLGGSVVLLGGEWRDGSARGASELALHLDLDASTEAFRLLPPLPPAGSRRLAVERSPGVIEVVGGYRFTSPLDPSATAGRTGVEVAGDHVRLVHPSLAMSPTPGGD